MHLFYLAVICFVYIQITSCKLIEIKCPSSCKCDMFEKYRRATCSNKSLAVIETDLPRETEILDISFNYISDLEDHTFHDQNLLSLKLLNMSHNKLSQIHMNAFDGLTELKTLDLSYNSIQHIVPNWFWSLASLKELYLRKNYFKILGPDPQFESNSLTKLDLSSCMISYIGRDVLLKVPNLEILDISENWLISLEVDVVKPLMNLTVLKVDNNTLSCNSETEKLADYCVQRGIKFKNPCAIAPLNSTMFERMVNAAPEIEYEKNSWIFDESEIANNTIIQVCSNNNDSVINNTTDVDKSMIMQIIHLSPILSILIPFIYGIVVGILIGCTVQIRNKSRKDLRQDENTYAGFDEGGHLKRSRSATLTRGRSNNSLFSNRKRHPEYAESLVLNEWTFAESTPVMTRKQ